MRTFTRLELLQMQVNIAKHQRALGGHARHAEMAPVKEAIVKAWLALPAEQRARRGARTQFARAMIRANSWPKNEKTVLEWLRGK